MTPTPVQSTMDANFSADSGASGASGAIPASAASGQDVWAVLDNARSLRRPIVSEDGTPYTPPPPQTELLARLIGGSHIVLPGFQSDPQGPSAASLMRPGVTFVESAQAPFEQEAAKARSATLRRRMSYVALALALPAAAALGAWFEAERPHGAPAAAAPTAWFAQSVDDAGVNIVLGRGSGARKETVAVGQALPNAETVLAVNKANSSYVTARSIVIVRTAP